MALDSSALTRSPYFDTGEKETLRKLIEQVKLEVIAFIVANPNLLELSLNDLTDVAVPAPTDLDRLTFDSGTVEWIGDDSNYAAGDTGSIQYNSAFGVLAGVDTFTFTPASGRGTLALGGTTYTNFTEEDMEVLEVRATNASTAQTANLAVGSGSGAAQAYAGLTVGSKNLFVREDGTIDSGGVISLQCDSFICDPAGTPSNLTNGHIWYDSASDKFKAREDGSTVDLLPFGSTISTLSGTSETISRASTPTYYRTTNGAAVAVTISPASTGNWVANDIIELEQAGAGAVTLTAGAGVTLNVQADLTLVTNGQYSVVGLKYIGSDVWTVLGNLVPA